MKKKKKKFKNRKKKKVFTSERLKTFTLFIVHVLHS